jgi:hypothetical protein
MRRNANGQKRNDQKPSSLALSRQRWEQEQERLHGCKYVNGVCTVHGSTTGAGSEGVGTQATGLVCTCRAFSYPHHPKLHDTLPGRFPGDTERRRFEDAAATDWRTPAGREARPESVSEPESATEQEEGGASRRRE